VTLLQISSKPGSSHFGMQLDVLDMLDRLHVAHQITDLVWPDPLSDYLPRIHPRNSSFLTLCLSQESFLKGHLTSLRLCILNQCLSRVNFLKYLFSQESRLFTRHDRLDDLVLNSLLDILQLALPFSLLSHLGIQSLLVTDFDSFIKGLLRSITFLKQLVNLILLDLHPVFNRLLIEQILLFTRHHMSQPWVVMPIVQGTVLVVTGKALHLV
jgi:hypothetical protein